MTKRANDFSLLLLNVVSDSVRIVEKIGDVVYSDKAISPETKKQVDALIINLNSVFTEAIKKVEAQGE